MKMTKQGQADLLNEFRASDPRYFDTIPLATAESVLDVTRTIAKYPALLNEFSRLIEKVAYSFANSAQFENPLAQFKKHSMEYGGSIEEMFVGLTKSKAFNPTKSQQDIFEKEDPDISVAYHTENRKERYAVVIPDHDMKSAFMAEDGLSDVVSRIIGSMNVSNERDEYVLMKSMLESAYRLGEVYFVEVGDKPQEFIKKARAYAGKIPFPTSNTYNAAGAENSTPIDKMNLFISSDTSAEVDVDVLSAAYNMTNADFVGRKTVLDKLYDDNVWGIFVDDSFFVVADKVKRTTSFFDPSALTTKYWLHVQQVLSRSPFATAIAFVKVLPEWAKKRVVASKQAAVVGGYFPEEVIQVGVEGFDALVKTEIPEYTLTAKVEGSDISAVVDEEDKTVTLKLTDNARRQAKNKVTITATFSGEEVYTTEVVAQVSQYHGIE